MNITQITRTLVSTLLCSSLAASEWNFNFGSTHSDEGVMIQQLNPYSTELGYGFEWMKDLRIVDLPGPSNPAATGIRSEHPYVFSVETGEGNFKITAEFVATQTSKGITIKAESRRLMVHLPELEMQTGQTKQISFVTNVRNTRLAQGGDVTITHREVGAWHWDDALQIEVHTPFALSTLKIQKIEKSPVLYIMGDSTVTDQTGEPWTGWGQILPIFFNPSIVVSNHAESGETLKAFRAERRLEKVMDTLKAGDFVMIQFGHNDMKEKGDGIGAMTSYTEDLQYFIRHIRGAGAQPILITSMKRRRFDAEGRQFATLKDYPLAIRKVAAEQEVPLVDLNFMSGVFYAALGPEDSKKAFVHYPAGTFPGQEKELKDDTHFNVYGAYELANCVIEAIKTSCPDLAKHLKADIPLYDPSTPHDPESLLIPASPRASIEKPAGN